MHQQQPPHHWRRLLLHIAPLSAAVCCRSLSFDHPNLVRALHYARLRINPNSPEATLVSGGSSLVDTRSQGREKTSCFAGAPVRTSPPQGTPSTAGSLFLPEGAVGVFDLPSTWAVTQRQGLQGPAPMIDT
jgi:hypothetical protein